MSNAKDKAPSIRVKMYQTFFFYFYNYLHYLDSLCSNLLNLKNKITKIEHKKIFCGTSKILKNISWPINICLKYFVTSTKILRPPSYILNMLSLNLDVIFLLFLFTNFFFRNQLHFFACSLKDSQNFFK